MLISMQSTCDWAGANPVHKKFVEGEKNLEEGHIVKCGKSIEKSTSDVVSFTAVP